MSTEPKNKTKSGGRGQVVEVSIKLDGSFRRCWDMLAVLVASQRFSEGFLGDLERRALNSIEIKDVNHPALGARVPLGITVGQDYVKLLTALVAVNALCDGEIPFHKFSPVKTETKKNKTKVRP